MSYEPRRSVRPERPTSLPAGPTPTPPPSGTSFARPRRPKVVSACTTSSGAPLIVLDDGQAFVLLPMYDPAEWQALPPVPGTEAAEREVRTDAAPEQATDRRTPHYTSGEAAEREGGTDG